MEYIEGETLVEVVGKDAALRRMYSITMPGVISPSGRFSLSWDGTEMIYTEGRLSSKLVLVENLR